jgi:LPS-assembly protein
MIATQEDTIPGRAEEQPSATCGHSGRSDAPPHRCSPGNTGIGYPPSENSTALTDSYAACYRAQLSPLPVPNRASVLDRLSLGTTLLTFCHELSLVRLLIFSSLVIRLGAQSYTPSLPPPPPTPLQPSTNPNLAIQLPRPEAPDKEYVVTASLCDAEPVCAQQDEGDWIYLRGRHRIETTDSELRADELDYNKETGYVEARGKVEYQNFVTMEKLYADKVEYYAHKDEETGKFYNVSGSAPFRVDTRPGLLTTTNPFYFQAKWAEKIQDKYILHQGYLTDCVIPDPWWTLRGNLFEIHPREYAIAHRSWFYVRSVPLLYLPIFRKRLEKHPRHSGILLPSGGTNSLKGYFVDAGYYWAISRSYDLTYEGTYFSNVGLQHNAEFRGKVNEFTKFDITINGLDNKSNNPSISAGGFYLLADGSSVLGNGWEAHGHLDLLSSFAYRSEFSMTINEAVFTQTDSVAFIDKHMGDFGVTFAVDRDVNFLSATQGDSIEVRKLPEADFVVRDHQLFGLPLWFSLDSSSGALYRTEPDFQTRQFVPRNNFVPAVNTSFHLGGIYISPSFAIHETFYGSSFSTAGQPSAGQSAASGVSPAELVSGANLVRSARDVGVNIVLPSLERIYDAPSWLGQKVKHVIEPRITYRYVDGIDNFSQIIRFDQTELLSDTNQVEFSLANRLLAKDKNGTVSDLLSWQLYYDRYFNPTFGGAVLPVQPNLVQSVADLTGYTFLDGPRHQSPVVSALRLQTRVSVDYRTEWDPVRHEFVDMGITAGYRLQNLALSVGETRVRTDPILLANTDQLRAQVTYGNQNKRGLSYGASMFYDVNLGVLEYMSSQISYNTDCCGLSAQYRRFAFGTRDEHQMLFSFSISNIGSVGTLNRQQRMF